MKKFISYLLFIFITPAIAMADNHSPEMIADAWVMVPKAGHEEKFEEALKKHMKYRQENGDTRSWHTYRPVTGNDLNYYVVRSCCNTWADQDTYVAMSNEKFSEDFGKNVAPYVETYRHNFSAMDRENSNWPAGTDASYVGVTTYMMKPGTAGARMEAIAQMSTLAKEKEWPRAWSWSYPIGGKSSWQLATPFSNYADMAPMEENFYQFAKKHMKDDAAVDAMFAQFSSTFTSTSYTIYRHVPDLSMMSED